MNTQTTTSGPAAVALVADARHQAAPFDPVEQAGDARAEVTAEIKETDLMMDDYRSVFGLG